MRRCRRPPRSCPYGYVNRPGLGCVKRCPKGQFFRTGQCRPAKKKCGEGFFYSYWKKRCMRRCRRGFYWSYKNKACKKVSW
ncbi:MAG: hypothetical protein CL920_23585 [Deltaproteobacteria bacterium]|nr:hypothetical protein [Deltaproteobacteria bacterium]MBU51684.1 hypothetical protein [Deltaproteobacteria bacterium]